MKMTSLISALKRATIAFEIFSDALDVSRAGEKPPPAHRSGGALAHKRWKYRRASSGRARR